MHKTAFLFFFLACFSGLSGQIGGENSFELLSLPSNARVTAAGGTLISVADDDLGLVLSNPALLNRGMHQQLSLNTVTWMGAANHGNLQYARFNEKWGLPYTFGLQYATYGKFRGADVNGVAQGSFGAGDLVLHGGSSYQHLNYHFGGTFKFMYSQYEQFSALGLGLDLSATFIDTARDFTAALVFRNIGGQLKAFQGSDRAPLPFDVQLGLSKKLKKAPFRFILTLHNLFRWDVSYRDPATLGNSGNLFSNDSVRVSEKPPFLDNLFRHFIFATEITVAKLVRFSIGYNHLRRQELRLANKGGFAGLSLGIGVKTRKFSVDYAFGGYHQAGGAHHFSFLFRLDQLIRKQAPRKIRTDDSVSG